MTLLFKSISHRAGVVLLVFGVLIGGTAVVAAGVIAATPVKTVTVCANN